MSGKDIIDVEIVDDEEFGTTGLMFDEITVIKQERPANTSVLRKLRAPSARRRIEDYFELQQLREEIDDPHYCF